MTAAQISVNLTLPDDFVEQVAQRVAELLAERQSDADGFLDTDGAARFLSTSKSRIYSLVSARRIPFRKDGSRLVFERGELRAWVERGGETCP